MAVCRLFICFFLLTALQDGNIGHVNAQVPTYTGKEGETITITCFPFSSDFSPSRARFCRVTCEKENIVTVTQGSRSQNGRYSIEISKEFVSVSIAQLEKSDVGRYRCSGNQFFKITHMDFDINVTEVPTTVPSETSPTDSGFFLPMVVSVSVAVLLLAVVLLLIYKKKDSVCGSRRKRSDHNKTEDVIYENCHPARTHEDSVYQSLDAASTEQNQTYCTLHNTNRDFTKHLE